MMPVLLVILIPLAALFIFAVVLDLRKERRLRSAPAGTKSARTWLV
jgi:hypothetical protein